MAKYVTARLYKRENQKLRAYKHRNHISSNSEAIRIILQNLKLGQSEDIKKYKKIEELIRGINDTYPFDEIELRNKIKEIMKIG